MVIYLVRYNVLQTNFKVHTINTLRVTITVPIVGYTAKCHLFQFLSNQKITMRRVLTETCKIVKPWLASSCMNE